MQVVYVCGGKGHRLHPRSAGGKSLVPVGGASLLTRLVDRFAPYHRSNKPPVVIVDAADAETRRVVDARLPGACVVAQPHADGVANALLLARPVLDRTVLVTLGDLFLHGTLSAVELRPSLVVWSEADATDVRQNFGVVFGAGAVSRVVEKPRDCVGMQCGIGVYVLTPPVISCFHAAAIDVRTGERGITEGLQAAIEAGVDFHVVRFSGYYRNINSRADVAAVEDYLARPVR